MESDLLLTKAHNTPCATAQRLEERTRALEKWQERQNGSLGDLADEVEMLSKTIDGFRDAVIKAQWGALIAAGGVILTLVFKLAGIA